MEKKSMYESINISEYNVLLHATHKIHYLKYARIDSIIAKAVTPNPIGLNTFSICKIGISNAKV